jgi:ribonuclease Z
MHADHYMGLPALLLHWRVRTSSLGGLTIVGPKATVRAGVERAMNFVFHDSKNLSAEIAEMPNIVELEGDSVYETDEFIIKAMDSDHAVPGLCYNITHKASGKTVGFTGDTRYLSEFENFFKNADMLLHECSFGGGPIDPVVNAGCRHASAQEAVEVCKKANVKKLMLTHTYEPRRESALSYAREHIDIPVEWAVPYRTFEV